MSDKLYAIRELKTHFVKSEKMFKVIPVLHYCDDKSALELLTAISKENPHENVRQFANLLLGQQVIRTNGDMASKSFKAAILGNGGNNALDQASRAGVSAVARQDLASLARLNKHKFKSTE